MIRILLYRYVKRVPQQTLLLDEEPAKPLKADSELQGWCMHPLCYMNLTVHNYVGFRCHKRPRLLEKRRNVFCGFGPFTSQKLLRIDSLNSRPPTISPNDQHRLLRERASKLLKIGNFPEHRPRSAAH